MSIDTETFARYARAEKDLCQKAGAAMSKIIKEVEESHGLKIAEMRVTVDHSHLSNSWPVANYVIVREHQGTPSDSVGNIEQSLDKWLVHSARLHHNQSY